MVRKLRIMAFYSSTKYNSLVCVNTVRNMYTITLFAYRNLPTAVSIGSDLSFSGSKLNFHILCLSFGPPIIPRIPHSGVSRTTHKLMPRDTRPSRPLLKTNSIVDTHTLIIQVFPNIPRANFLQNSS